LRENEVGQKNIFIVFFKKILPFIGLGIFFFLILNIGVHRVVSTFLSISPVYIVAAAILTLPRILIRNLAWQSILKQQKMRINFSSSLRILLIGYFYATLTPGYMGHLMRMPYIKEEIDEPYGKLFVNTLIEIFVRNVSLFILVLTGTLFILHYEPFVFYVTLLFILITFIIYWFFAKESRGVSFFNFIVRYLLPEKFKSKAALIINSFYKDFPDIRSLFFPFILGLFTWIIIFSQIYIIGLSLGIDVPYHVFLVVYPIANIIGFIPITSSGFGTREAAVIFLFGLFGVSADKALVLSVAGFLITDFLTGFYGFILSLSKVFQKK